MAHIDFSLVFTGPHWDSIEFTTVLWDELFRLYCTNRRNMQRLRFANVWTSMHQAKQTIAKLKPKTLVFLAPQLQLSKGLIRKVQYKTVELDYVVVSSSVLSRPTWQPNKRVVVMNWSLSLVSLYLSTRSFIWLNCLITFKIVLKTKTKNNVILWLMIRAGKKWDITFLPKPSETAAWSSWDWER